MVIWLATTMQLHIHNRPCLATAYRVPQYSGHSPWFRSGRALPITLERGFGLGRPAIPFVIHLAKTNETTSPTANQTKTSRYTDVRGETVMEMQQGKVRVRASLDLRAGPPKPELKRAALFRDVAIVAEMPGADYWSRQSCYDMKVCTETCLMHVITQSTALGRQHFGPDVELLNVWKVNFQWFETPLV
ncbi:predicted protein [Pyrenophora tritici-repentis Pt-1C-BFP]|uniref:Uncharacterized protein n=1 Tax=Pyrenophora tritici-repentis (strain Pt-1C-BFP) TaxID=426418 RepID=B2VUS3_PYRTR|nr:uncharacterized protein PTRG_01060 [Pyrenophora tritici-repentis Pt-1C-BFP]EDU40498.1 predicted protein [Pyrenophora tritici-repentis Pt-1C-BFP]